MAYSNLRDELYKRGITLSAVAKLLEVHPNTITNKLEGTTEFSIGEAFQIKENLIPEMELLYLFNNVPNPPPTERSR